MNQTPVREKVIVMKTGGVNPEQIAEPHLLCISSAGYTVNVQSRQGLPTTGLPSTGHSEKVILAIKNLEASVVAAAIHGGTVDAQKLEHFPPNLEINFGQVLVNVP